MTQSTPSQAELLTFLMGYLTPERTELFERLLPERTRFLTVVLEDIYQPQNASAVVRTADCLGIQDIHIIENRNAYQLNPGVSLGSSNWVYLHKYREAEDNTTACLTQLKEQGYQIIATSPHANSVNLPDLQLDRPSALLFGNEKMGLTESALEQADVHLRIPMYGFTESYNLSVSAAICLYTLTQQLRNSSQDWRLSESEYQQILLDWTRKSVKLSDKMERAFMAGKIPPTT